MHYSKIFFRDRLLIYDKDHQDSDFLKDKQA